MDISSVAAAASSNAAASVQAQASFKVLKKAIDVQAAGAIQLLRALPQPPANLVGSVAGRIIDTWA